MTTAVFEFPAAEGMYDLPPGKLAAIVTSLEMPLPAAPGTAATTPDGIELSGRQKPTVPDYLGVYRKVGADWLWCSRLQMSDGELTSVIHDNAVEVYFVLCDGEPEGLLELDFRENGNCELAFFGVSAGLIGRGIGNWLMGRAKALASRPGVARFWVHTCTLDHPAALAFYRKSGFVPFKQQVEIMDDPRLDGTLPVDVAQHVPLLQRP